MRLWEQIKSWLFSPPRRPRKLHHPDLYPLVVESIAKELALEEEAKRLGEAGIPAPDAISLCGPESKVVQRIDRARQDYVDWANLRLEVINDDLSKRDVTKLINRALQAEREFERKAGTLLADSESMTTDLANIAMRRQQEVDEFRQHHCLRRDPHYPTGAASFSRYALLALLIVVEGMFNAFFFSQGLTTGLIGGFIAAALFAALNLCVAFGWGKFVVPFTTHRGALQKALGVLGAVLAFACMLGISMMIAHFRDALVADAAEPAKAAWQAMKVSPFDLNDIMSWVLFGVSMVFAVGAFFDGVSSDDLYPGYGKIARRATDARSEYVEEVRHIRASLDALKEEELEALEESAKQAQSLVSQQAAFIQDKMSAESRLRNALRDAENCLDALIETFRTANEIHRGETPRPAYFDTRPQLRDLTLPDFGIVADQATQRRQQDLVGSLLARMGDLRANIQASFNREYDRLTPLDAHFQPERKAA